MKRKKGVSLLNVMIFLLFSGMVTAQVFFFTATSIESVSEEREIMQYRMRLDELVEIAKDAVRNITVDDTIHEAAFADDVVTGIKSFYEETKATNLWGDDDIPDKWRDKYGETYHVRVHNLWYTFNTAFDRKKWIDGQYSGKNIYQKVFAAMPPERESANEGEDPNNRPITGRYYLIRARAELPEKFNGQNIMYQVLVVRQEADSHKVETLSFQEIWYGSD